MSDEPKLFKDNFNQAAAQSLGEQIANAWPAFDLKRFVELATEGLSALELLARVEVFASALAECLPPAFPKAIEILEASLPPALADCEQLSVGWFQWPISHYIANRGLDHIELSLGFLAEYTQRFSAEFAVRPFAANDPERTFPFLYALLKHPNPHVRRWCSEGVRPRLPWGIRLKNLVNDPSPLWPIIEALKDDPELYVRRSVANNLNDIAKDHPDLVIARCKKWSRKKTPERQKLIKHALRTLIKNGHPDALAVIGFDAPKKIGASLKTNRRSVNIGESVELAASLVSSADTDQPLLLDYSVHFIRKDGSTGAKTFKWTELTLAPEETKSVRKKHPFKLTTIRTLYPGAHRIELQLNGQKVAEASIHLGSPVN